MYLKMHCAECSMCVAIDQLNRISSMQFTKFFELIFSIDLRYGFWNKLKICAKKMLSLTVYILLSSDLMQKLM